MIDARVLVDNCVPYRFTRFVRAALVAHVRDLGWDALKDRPLLERADDSFDLILTTDRNLPDQQNLIRYRLALVIMRAPTNALPLLAPLADEVNRRIEDARSGETIKVFAPGFRPRDYYRP